MNKLKWVAAAVMAAVVLVVGGTWVYINVIRDDPPERLAFEAAPERIDDSADEGDPGEVADVAPPTAGSDGDDGDDADATSGTASDNVSGSSNVSGTWAPTDESVVGYRVGEILFGQSTEGVGRTNEIVGEMTIDGTTVTGASFEVDMATVESDDDRRDSQFRGRIMDVAAHPTAMLRLAEPIELEPLPDQGEVVETTAQVELTLRGTTRTVPVDIRARLVDGTIEVNGSILIVFQEWGIPNPSTPAISTEDEGDLEFLIVMAPS